MKKYISVIACIAIIASACGCSSAHETSLPTADSSEAASSYNATSDTTSFHSEPTTSVKEEYSPTDIGGRAEAKISDEAFAADGAAAEDVMLSESGVFEPAEGCEEQYIVQIPPEAGLLTGGEWCDNAHWNDWLSLYQTHQEWNCYKDEWRISFDRRIPVIVTSNGEPVEGAKVFFGEECKAVTDNSGIAYLFQGSTEGSEALITAEYNGITAQADITDDGTAAIELGQTEKRSAKTLDLMLVVDTTGSMSDELSYLQKELEDVVTTVKADNANIPTRISVNFYRDEGDEYVVRSFPFSENLGEVVNAISQQTSDGGGDTPEAVHTALENAIEGHNWNEDSVKLMFLVLDAPPHSEPHIIHQTNSLVAKAASMGIRIIPIASSGIDKSTEYLLRTMSFMTGGTYTFLTDHSGIGGSHIEPTIGDYEVERLNEMLVRIISRYLKDNTQTPETSQTEPQPANEPAKLSERSPEEFTFIGFSTEYIDGQQIRYRGEITDSEIISQLWDIITRQEQQHEYTQGTWDSPSQLTLIDKQTGKSCYVGYGIHYDNEFEDGGPSVFVVSANGTSRCYAEIGNADEWTFLKDDFNRLIHESTAFQYNIAND